jgi:hypothetical protein
MGSVQPQQAQAASPQHPEVQQQHQEHSGQQKWQWTY